uniref:Flavodoxin-like domain-containing protein n=1 Tax=Heterorhabditis bacteriophora TaxID=37862 RepID=A0A1I7XKQ4_HETBA
MSSLLIVYGSETGTAEDIAESLSREARLQNIPVRLLGFDGYDVDILPLEVMTIFVVATTGQGEFPPNMRGAWRRLLRKNLSVEWLSGARIAVLGLGDSSYQKYNFAGKKLFRRLLQLGAEAIIDLGLADDQHELGIDGALIPWRKALWGAISRLKLFETMNTGFDPTTPLPSKYRLIFDKEMFLMKDYDSRQDYEELTVSANLRVTADNHFQDTRLIRFCTKKNPLFEYNPGDVLMIRPYNLEESIETVITALQYNNDVLDSPFVLKSNDPFIKPPLPWLIGGEQ